MPIVGFRTYCSSTEIIHTIVHSQWRLDGDDSLHCPMNILEMSHVEELEDIWGTERKVGFFRVEVVIQKTEVIKQNVGHTTEQFMVGGKQQEAENDGKASGANVMVPITEFLICLNMSVNHWKQSGTCTYN